MSGKGVHLAFEGNKGNDVFEVVEQGVKFGNIKCCIVVEKGK